jgi:hypothetical protein
MGFGRGEQHISASALVSATKSGWQGSEFTTEVFTLRRTDESADPPPRFPGESRDPLLPWAPAFAGEAVLSEVFIAG